MTDVTENTDIKTVNKPWQFQPGQSGNPAGKPKGAKHKATLAAMVLLDGEAETLTRKAVELALGGDTVALKMCLDRIAPTLRSTAPPIRLEGTLPNSLTGTAKAFVDAASSGEVPPDIAAQMISAIANVARVEEMESLKERLESLERAIKKRK